MMLPAHLDGGGAADGRRREHLQPHAERRHRAGERGRRRPAEQHRHTVTARRDRRHDRGLDEPRAGRVDHLRDRLLERRRDRIQVGVQVTRLEERRRLTCGLERRARRDRGEEDVAVARELGRGLHQRRLALGGALPDPRPEIRRVRLDIERGQAIDPLPISAPCRSSIPLRRTR